MNYQRNPQSGLRWPFPVQYEKVNRIRTDVLIVGGSFAGCCAAISAARRGVTVALVDKAPIKRSGNGGAGIDHWNSIFDNPKSPMSSEEVIEKTMKTVHSLGHRDYIAMKGTWAALLELEKLGLPVRDEHGDFEGTACYDKDSKLLKAYNYQDMVSVKLRGGHYIKPILYMSLKKDKQVSLYERVMVTKLLTENGRQGGRVIGAMGFSLETGEFYVFQAKSVVISTGYITGCWTFNTELAGGGYREDPNDVGEGFAMAWEAGADIYGLSNAGSPGGTSPVSWPIYGFGNCTNTWFPCTVVDNSGREIPWEDVNGDIIPTVAARNLPVKGQPYMNVSSSDKMPGIDTPDLIMDLGKQIRQGAYQMPLWADLSQMPEEERRSIWGMMIGNEGKTRYAIYDYYTRWGFNPDKDLLMGNIVDPADTRKGHGWFSGKPGEADNISFWRSEGRVYGNIACDWDLMTSLPGLFCAGAASGLEGCSFACSTGFYAGNRASEFAQGQDFLPPDEQQIEAERARVYAPVGRNGQKDAYVSWKELWAGTCRVMQSCCGEFKTIEILEYGLLWLKSIREYEVNLTYARNPHELARVLECETRLTCSEAFIQGCIAYIKEQEAGVSQEDYLFYRLHNGQLVTSRKPHNYWLQSPYAPTYLENYQLHRAAEGGTQKNV